MNNTHKYKFRCMTTACVLILHHEQEAVANQVATEIYEQTMALEKKYNFYSADSWLTQTINERVGDSVTLDAQTARVLSQVRSISELTNGVFDVCVGTIKPHEQLNEGKRSQQVAKLIKQQDMDREQLLTYYQEAMGLQAWHLQDNQLYFTHEMTRMDLGGVIKEYAVDKAAQLLQQHGLAGMISFGGDLKVVGVKPDGQPYRIGIKDPFDTSKSCMNVPVTDEALTTSGLYERQETLAKKHYHHVINPQVATVNIQADALSSTAEVLSATVIHQSTLVSGMLSTALLLNPTVALPSHSKVILIHADAEVTARKG